MRMFILLMSWPLLGCGTAAFEGLERPRLWSTEGESTAAGAETGSFDSAASNGSTAAVDSLNAASGGVAAGTAAAQDGAGSGNLGNAPASGAAGAMEKSPAAEQAAAYAKACPQVDPKIIEQLIASGQPFEVECEVEIEVGPDND